MGHEPTILFHRNRSEHRLLRAGRRNEKSLSYPCAQVKLGLSTYSYWHFRPPKISIETVIEKAGQLGVEGVDILHRQMESEDRAYLQKLKRLAFVNGVDLICLSIHQDFVDPTPPSARRISTTPCVALSWLTKWVFPASG